MKPVLVAFAGGPTGEWRVESLAAVTGDPLPEVSHVSLLAEEAAVWILRGVVSNERYTTRAERDRLFARQEPLGRPEATHAALIPIRKSDAWWALSQDERRAIFEERSRHIAIGLEFLPAIARRLHHSRDLGEPFDFLTWFEFAPEHADGFDELVRRLRDTPEWEFVDREIDIRLSRAN